MDPFLGCLCKRKNDDTGTIFCSEGVSLMRFPDLYREAEAAAWEYFGRWMGIAKAKRESERKKERGETKG